STSPRVLAPQGAALVVASARPYRFAPRLRRGYARGPWPLWSAGGGGPLLVRQRFRRGRKGSGETRQVKGEFQGPAQGVAGALPHAGHLEDVAAGAGVGFEKPEAAAAVDADVDAQLADVAGAAAGPVEQLRHGQRDALDLPAHGRGLVRIETELFLQQRLQAAGVAAAVNVGNEAPTAAHPGARASHPQDALAVPLHQHPHVENASPVAEQVDFGLNEPYPPGPAEQHAHDARQVPAAAPVDAAAAVGVAIDAPAAAVGADEPDRYALAAARRFDVHRAMPAQHGRQVRGAAQHHRLGDVPRELGNLGHLPVHPPFGPDPGVELLDAPPAQPVLDAHDAAVDHAPVVEDVGQRKAAADPAPALLPRDAVDDAPGGIHVPGFEHVHAHVHGAAEPD